MAFRILKQRSWFDLACRECIYFCPPSRNCQLVVSNGGMVKLSYSWRNCSSSGFVEGRSQGKERHLFATMYKLDSELYLLSEVIHYLSTYIRQHHHHHRPPFIRQPPSNQILFNAIHPPCSIPPSPPIVLHSTYPNPSLESSSTIP